MSMSSMPLSASLSHASLPNNNNIKKDQGKKVDKDKIHWGLFIACASTVVLTQGLLNLPALIHENPDASRLTLFNEAVQHAAENDAALLPLWAGRRAYKHYAKQYHS